MVWKYRCPPRSALWSVLAIFLASPAGCVLVPKTQLDDSQKVAQILRSENARLKDQVLVLRSENRDASDRAIDDAQRLAAQDEAIGRLETSVRAYQDDRERLASAVQEIKANLELSSRGPRPPVGVRKSAPADRSDHPDEARDAGIQPVDNLEDPKNDR
jgi:predicted RNase H-like nuclease (RuvC/YqgF family)